MQDFPIPVRWLKLKAAEQEACHKIFNTANGWVAKNINKRISLPISIFLARWGVTPNQITYINGFLGVYSGVLAASGDVFHLLLAGLLFQLVSILDGCDGEVAKLTNSSSRFGAWLDTAADNISFIAFAGGVAYGLYHKTHAPWLVLASEISAVSCVILFGIMIHYLVRNKNSNASLVVYEKEVVSRSVEGSKTFLGHFIFYGKYLVKKDFFSFLFALMAILNQPQVIVFLTALGSALVAIVLTSLTLKQIYASRAALSHDISERP